MQVSQLHPLFVGEITGLDTSAPVTAETVQAVEEAMAKYAVCVIRDASLKDEDRHPLQPRLRAAGAATARRQADRARALRHRQSGRQRRDQAAKSQPAESGGLRTVSYGQSLQLVADQVVAAAGVHHAARRARTPNTSIPAPCTKTCRRPLKDRVENLVVEHDLFRALKRSGVEFGNEAMRKSLSRRCRIRVGGCPRAGARRSTWAGMRSASWVGAKRRR